MRILFGSDANPDFEVLVKGECGESDAVTVELHRTVRVQVTSQLGRMKPLRQMKDLDVEEAVRLGLLLQRSTDPLETWDFCRGHIV